MTGACLSARAGVRPRVNVLGVGIDAVAPDETVARLLTAADRRERGYVCVTGVHGVSEAQRDEQLRRALNDSMLTVPDGMPMVWLGRWHGYERIDRVYGPDLMLRVCEASVARGLTHFLYGGAPGVAEELAARLQARIPGLRIAGCFTPPFRPLDAAERALLQARVAEAKPDFFWVGLSTPKQERFMADHGPMLDATVMIGVGAAFDMHSGRLAQAPRWMQRTGLEWFYRLLREPRRLFWRYARNNPLFIGRTILQLSGLRRYD